MLRFRIGSYSVLVVLSFNNKVAFKYCFNRFLPVLSCFCVASITGVPWGVVGAAVVALVAAQFLEAHPNVGLDVFDHVAEVDAAVGIGQGGGNEDFAWFGHVGYRLNLVKIRGYYATKSGG